MNREKFKFNYDCGLDIVNNVIDDIFDYFESRTCATCKHYDFEEESMQTCLNIHNLQLNDDNPTQEEKWYRMMVTPSFGCNEWDKK